MRKGTVDELVRSGEGTVEAKVRKRRLKMGRKGTMQSNGAKDSRRSPPGEKLPIRLANARVHKDGVDEGRTPQVLNPRCIFERNEGKGFFKVRFRYLLIGPVRNHVPCHNCVSK
jgi:hypothetical protein